ncbi:MAG: S-adenosylmethionine decarboxylase [Woeseiaceae bacterium]
MKNLAPGILRQRLLIEGSFSVDVDEATVANYLTGVAGHLSLRTYGEASVHATGGAGKAENEGYDAFIPLIDSGISLYVWSQQKFFAALLFTCKEFDEKDAVSYTRDFFAATEVAHMGF